MIIILSATCGWWQQLPSPTPTLTVRAIEVNVAKLMRQTSGMRFGTQHKHKHRHQLKLKLLTHALLLAPQLNACLTGLPGWFNNLQSA